MMKATPREREIRVRMTAPRPGPPRAPLVLDRFVLNQASLRPFHVPFIDLLADRIAASWRTPRPVRVLTLVGHTDASGPSPYNFQLGRRRASAVRARLQTALTKANSSLPARVRIFAFSAGA